MRLVIIGGSDAGISAALRARELAPEVDISILVADAFPNYSICGLPFDLSGEVEDWRHLAHRTVSEIERTGVRLLLQHCARAVDPHTRTVTVADPHEHVRTLTYDRLIIATGAIPFRPPIDGLDLSGVFCLHSMSSSLAMNRFISERLPRTALIVGSGYIGMEMADALTLRGIKVTLVGRSESVLPTVDTELGRLVETELQQHGVRVINQIEISAISARDNRLIVSGTQGFRQETDMVLVATGVRPASELATAAGIATGIRGAICVNRRMETETPDVYAAGDCVETWHQLLHRCRYLPLGTTSHKQGRIAGENAVGGKRTFAGCLGTQVVKIFELAIARTGLSESEAAAAGFEPLTLETTTWDHKPYYPDAHRLRIRITGDRHSSRLLGGQIVGHWRSEVAKRIDVMATAIFHGMKVGQLNDLDLSYTPPFSSPWDPIQMSAQAWEQTSG